MSEDRLPEAPRRAGRTFDAMVEVFDRQIQDAEGQPIATVADVEVAGLDLGREIAAGEPPPRITALLDGPVLATRIFGGRPPESRLHGVTWDSVSDLGGVIRVDTHGDDMDITWLERWVRDRIISRIPGGRHDPD